MKANKDWQSVAPQNDILKLVVVGDAFVGKTSLLFSYTQNRFPEDYLTTVFENWAVTVTIEGRSHTLNLFDTAGQEDYARLRSLSYPGTDAFILCFSLVDKKTLNACETVWMPDIREHTRHDIPVILVGTKGDLRDEEYPQNIVTREQAVEVARKIGAVQYLECSALTQKGLKRVFDEAMLAALGRFEKPAKHDKNPFSCCAIS
uniref:Uncharacterized protein n=1 Tax=Plectus sambesii TaxID=2011161 RepID=A0A914UVU7_9BILA